MADIVKTRAQDSIIPQRVGKIENGVLQTEVEMYPAAQLRLKASLYIVALWGKGICKILLQRIFILCLPLSGYTFCMWEYKSSWRSALLAPCSLQFLALLGQAVCSTKPLCSATPILLTCKAFIAFMQEEFPIQGWVLNYRKVGPLLILKGWSITMASMIWANDSQCVNRVCSFIASYVDRMTEYKNEPRFTEINTLYSELYGDLSFERKVHVTNHKG